MITEAQLRQIFTPLTGDPSPRVCRTLSGNINTILKVEANGRMYGLRIRSQEQVYRYEPDLMKEVFISWLLDPSHAGADDTEKARALSQLREAQRGAGRKSSGIEPTGLAFDWSRQILPQPYFVYEWIEGEPLWDDPDTQLYWAAGHALASLHRVRFDAFYADFFAIGHTPQAWVDRFRAALDKEVGEARSRLGPTLSHAVEHIPMPTTLPFSPCLIHNDFSPGNILVRDGRLAAVIDWDNAVVDVAPLDFVKMKYWTAKDDRGQLGHNPVLFRAFVTGYGPRGPEIVESETFAWYELLWLLRVWNFEISKQERGLERAPGYPAAAEYAAFLEGAIDRLSARHGSFNPTSSSAPLKR